MRMMSYPPLGVSKNRELIFNKNEIKEKIEFGTRKDCETLRYAKA